MKLANYELLDIIGEGGFGLVYKARQLSTDQFVAIKVLKFDSNTSEQKRQHQIARFERETQLSARLNHPHIVKLLDKGHTDDNQLYAVFEYVEGQTLKDLVLEKNGLSAVATGELMGQILDGLASAHAQGIVHRDLKPTNIMVTKTGLKEHAKILDFGIGAFTSSFQPKDYTLLTLTRETIGTPAYSAPEQLRGEPPTTKSDLYAWGLILLECLVGSPVMRGDSVGEVFEQQLSANQVPLPPAIAEHPLGKLLRNVLEKNPLNRSADAHRVAEEFTKINFHTLVGQIQMPNTVITDGDVTSVNDLGYTTSTHRSEKRQITVLCVQLSLALTDSCDLDDETLDTIQEDQLALTTDIASRYGGYLAGSVANTITVYFGYPQKSENDARYAGRTALELISQAKKRSALLLRQHGVELDMRMGMHTGSVLLKKNSVPKGLIPNTAFSLLNKADSDSVLVSRTTRQVLDPYLEFEDAGKQKLAKNAEPELTYLLKGERASEALSFLRPWSAGRQMIGREEELKQMLDLWRKVDTGHGQAILVRGIAGIGKSKLVYEAKRRIGQEGCIVKDIRCFPEHQNNALYPFLEMLKKHLGILDLHEPGYKIGRLRSMLKEMGAEDESVLPILCSWLSIPLDDTLTGSQLPPEKQKEMLMGALKQLMTSLAKDEKYLMVVEDLHWIDPTSQELLENLIAELPGTPMMVLASARMEFSPAWDQHYLAKIDLKPLDEDKTKRMIRVVLDNQEIEDKTVQYISKRADGIPLFIEELTHMLLDREFLILENDTYRLDETQDISKVPVRLNDLLSSRLDRLGFAKETAQLAAAIGREFTYELLVQVSLRDEALVQADLDALAQADLIYHQRRVQGDSYIFRHALIRDAAYEGMPNTDREENHRRIAMTLENNFPDLVAENPWMVAEHYGASRGLEKAIHFGIIAAQTALSRSVYKVVLAITQKLYEWIEKLDEEVTRLANEFKVNGVRFPALLAVEGMGSPGLNKLGERNDALDSQLEELGYTDHRGDGTNPRLMPQFAEVQGSVYTGQYQKAITLGTQALSEAEANKDLTSKVILLNAVGQTYQTLGNLEEAEKYINEVLGLYDEEKHAELWKTFMVEPKAQGLLLRGFLNGCRGNIAQGYDDCMEALAWAQKVESQFFADFSITFAMWIAYLAADRQKVLDMVDEHLKKDGQQVGDWAMTYNMVLFEWAKNEYDHSIKYFDELVSQGRLPGLSIWEPLPAEGMMEQGQVAEGLSRLAVSSARTEELGEKWGVPTEQELLGYGKYLQNGLTEEVIGHFEAGIAEAKRQGSHTLELRVAVRYAEILKKEGQKEKALATLGNLIDHVDPIGGNALIDRAKQITDS